MQQAPEHELSIAILFPEVIGFVVIVVMSPVYAARLIHQRYYVQALVLGTCALVAAVAFVWLLRKDRRWSAWFTMLGFFLILWLLSLSLPEPAFRLLGPLAGVITDPGLPEA